MSCRIGSDWHCCYASIDQRRERKEGEKREKEEEREKGERRNRDRDGEEEEEVPAGPGGSGREQSGPGGGEEVSLSEGQALAEDWGCPFMETSAKSKTMVDELFSEIVRQMDFCPLPDRSRVCCPKCSLQMASKSVCILLQRPRSHRNAVFSREQSRQRALFPRTEKIEVSMQGPGLEGTLLVMNKGMSTPLSCARHLTEHHVNSSVLALVDGELWPLHKPSQTRAFWRSCSTLLGQVLETAFKDDFSVELLQSVEVPVTSGAFCCDVVLDPQLDSWTASEGNGFKPGRAPRINEEIVKADGCDEANKPTKDWQKEGPELRIVVEK
ncbi:hypothetical protein WMY93_022242 [Mugilogobius chulae]|uniref:Uncharacterized protein n=1 Tax=Mugilogobius chulae TaxID=88201 RepID=A0AAW0NBB2_9GOBI